MEGSMRRFPLVSVIAVLAACGGSADKNAPAADTTAAAAPAPAAPALALSDLAGKWNVDVMPEGKDTVILKYELTATGDSAGWSMKFSDRPKPVPLHVMPPQGDSVVVHGGPYPSALRKNVQVTTESVMRLQNGELVGKTTAHYSAGPDTVLVLRQHGTRAQ